MFTARMAKTLSEENAIKNHVKKTNRVLKLIDGAINDSISNGHTKVSMNWDSISCPLTYEAVEALKSYGYTVSYSEEDHRITMLISWN